MKLHPGPTMARLRQQKTDNMPHVVTVKRPGASVRGTGGMTRPGALSTVATYNGRCALATEATEEVRGEAQKLEATWVVVLPLNADCQFNDTLDVDAGSWGRTLQVVGLAAPGATLARTVFAVEPRNA